MLLKLRLLNALFTDEYIMNIYFVADCTREIHNIKTLSSSSEKHFKILTLVRGEDTWSLTRTKDAMQRTTFIWRKELSQDDASIQDWFKLFLQTLYKVKKIYTTQSTISFTLQKCIDFYKVCEIQYNKVHYFFNTWKRIDYFTFWRMCEHIDCEQ